MKIGINKEQKGYIIQAIEERHKRIFQYSSNLSLLSINEEIPPLQRKLAIQEMFRQNGEYSFLIWLSKLIQHNNLVIVETNEGD